LLPPQEDAIGEYCNYLDVDFRQQALSLHLGLLKTKMASKLLDSLGVVGSQSFLFSEQQ